MVSGCNLHTQYLGYRAKMVLVREKREEGWTVRRGKRGRVGGSGGPGETRETRQSNELLVVTNVKHWSGIIGYRARIIEKQAAVSF